MEQLYSAALFFHLLSFAATMGSAVAQHKMMDLSRKPGTDPATRDAYERNSAHVVSKVQLPAAFVLVLSGIALLVFFRPTYIRLPAMHVKLTLVAILLVLTHLAMFNARAIVRLRAAGGEAGAIDDRKKRHATFGAIGAILGITIVVIVAFFIRG